jgi:maltooligosyltrehalose trehalohydrolase
MLRSSLDRGGYGFDGCWSDDFHHVVRVMLTRQRESYFKSFEGTTGELAETIENGWLFRGQRKTAAGKLRGGDTSELEPQQFIYCISNHDQIGNRAFGDRLGENIDSAAYRAASALLLFAPETPMLFMGQEWQASTPFQFFTDHDEELGRKITKGRREEFQGFAAFTDPKNREKIPDPQAATTFQNSKLDWDEVNAPEHRRILALYREAIRLRREHTMFRNRSRDNLRVRELDNGAIAILFGLTTKRYGLIVCDLIGGHSSPDLDAIKLGSGSPIKWRSIFCSNDPSFAGDQEAPFNKPTTMLFEPAA